jgi:hypothetical protein
LKVAGHLEKPVQLAQLRELLSRLHAPEIAAQ